ncbi:hypothetical protein ACJIZ3_022854 [Penstemon smallii]|uniref:Uncharacterized protein n=1 Tax=Penstemon smallii TaxID=265156 RepID=A0ABD3TQC6_9LAMI
MVFIQIHINFFQVTKNPSFVCKCHVFFSASRREQQTNTPSISKRQFSLQAAPRVESVLKSPEKSDSLLSFLKETGFSTSQSEKILKYRPRFQSASLENSIMPKIKIFQDLGFPADEIAKLISTYPTILHSSANNRVIPSLSILKGILGSDEGVGKLLRTSGSFLTKDLGKTLIPNVKFLENCGIQMDQIIKVIYSYPRFLVHKPEIIRKCVVKADEMGVNRSSRMFIYAVRVVSSMNEESWELKLQTFRDMGFSEYDILRVFRTSPVVFGVSEKKLKKVKEVLLATGKYDMPCIVNHPLSLCCSVENRLKPRLRVLEILESKNLIANWPSLATLLTLSSKRFFEKFVSPYLDEVGGIYNAKSEVNDKRDY